MVTVMRASSSWSRIVPAVLAITLLSGCSLALRNPRIADLQHNPARYHDRMVSVDGIVTTSWGIPLVPVRIYRVSDGTGEVTVISQGGRTPVRGTRVRVRGRVNELAIIGGRPVGLHIQQQRVQIRR
jgi:hypothetical protein